MIESLQKALKEDEGYRISWQANIAVAFQDEVARFKKKTGKTSLSRQDIHAISNAAADNFLNALCQ